MITVISNQNIFDLAIQELGTFEEVLELAILNGISVTDLIEPGQNFLVKGTPKKDIKNFFKNQDLNIATGYNFSEVQLEPALGIGFMVIESNFTIA